MHEGKKKGTGYAEGRHGKGRLFRRGRVWWVQYYVHGLMKRESSDSAKQAVAEKLLMRRILAAEDGTLEPPRKKIIYEEMRERLITTWLLERPHISRKEHDYALTKLDAFFATMPSHAITEEKIDEFKLAQKATGLSDATINGYLRALRKMIKVSAKRIKNAPEIKLLPEPPARKGFLTREQYLRLDAALPQYLRPITAFAFRTGMREGELVNLTWKNIFMSKGMIHLEADQTKNNEARDIPFGRIPELANIMAELSANRVLDYVFVRPDRYKSGKFHHLGTFRKAWVRACIKAALGRMCWECPVCHKLVEVAEQPWPPESIPEEVPSCTCGVTCRWHYEGLIFHDLRRTGVRNLRRAGVQESVAMKISGHKDRGVFERYNIVDTADVEQAMEKLDQFQQAEDRKLEQPASRPN
jgi:integrase